MGRQALGWIGAAGAAGVLWPDPAFAHASEGGMVLLLPTGHYILGGTAAVAISVAVTAAFSARWTRAVHGARLGFPTLPRRPEFSDAIAIGAFLVWAFMVATGLLGRPDPLRNPLPAFIWTMVWTLLFFLHGIVGNLWALLNPWSGPLVLIRRFILPSAGETALRPLAPRLGHAPAILQFFAFAWFELVDLAPEDPRRLAVAVAGYWLVNLIGFVLFGAEWRRRGEPIGILFGLIARLAPLGFERAGDRIRPVLGLPCGRAYDLPALPATAVAFVLLCLSTVTFDGLSTTFVWLTAIGINPLEFPGRSEVVAASTLGLVLCFALFLASFSAAVWLGRRLSGAGAAGPIAGRLVVSILPIALAFQFAHYLTLALVGIQDFAAAMRAPFGTPLFGAGGEPAHVSLSFLNDFDAVSLIFTLQTGAITLGHLLAVVLAHGLLDAIPAPKRGAWLLELPFSLLMIGYTAFGLWLLSTPRV